MTSEVGKFPLEHDVRAKMREQTLHDYITKAAAEASRANRSMKCCGVSTVMGMRQHAYMEGGCTNDGTGCLCECHDIVAAPAVWEVGMFYHSKAGKIDTGVDYQCVHVWPNGEALMAWGDGSSCRLKPTRRHEFREVIMPRRGDDEIDNNIFREST